MSWEGFTDGGVKRTHDLSHGPYTYYTLREHGGRNYAVWLPVVMTVGRWEKRDVDVTVYKKATCVKVSGPDRAISYAKLVDVYYDVEFSGGEMAGKKLSGPIYDILVSWTTDEKDWFERYWFAAGMGLVQWWSASGDHSVIWEITEGQRDLPFKMPDCLVI